MLTFGFQIAARAVLEKHCLYFTTYVYFMNHFTCGNKKINYNDDE